MDGSKNEISPRLLFGVAIIGVMLSLVAIEITFRAIALFASAPARWSDRPLGFFMPDSARSLQEKTVTSKTKATFRISVVGDSFTFGPAMQLADTLPKRLEAFLNLNSTAKHVEVLNRGFSGYSTVNEVPVVKRALDEHSDLVILQITLNDAEPHILSPRARERIFEDPFSKTWVSRYWKSLAFIVNRLHNSRSKDAYIEYHSKFFFQPDTSSAFVGAIKAMKEMCAKKGVPFTIVLYPLFDFPFNEHYPFKKVHEFIKETAAGERVPFLDLEAAYRGIPNDRLQVIPGADSHPNEIAHRIAAERVVAFLAQQKLLPSLVAPKVVFSARKGHKGKPAEPEKIWSRSLRPLQDPDFFEKQAASRKEKQRPKPLRKKKREKKQQRKAADDKN